MKRHLALCALLFGCDPLLGGRCADGWTPPAHACDAGLVDVLIPHDLPDAFTADAGPVDVPMVDASPVDASPVDVPTDAPPGDAVCTPPQTRCGGLCVDKASSPANCGACGRACAAAEVCAAGVCLVTCAAPLLLCDGVCLDPRSDPFNCGGCGMVCSTGICSGGQCRDARAGHLVLIGHDYQTTRPDQNRVVGNAVFLSGAGAPRVAISTLGALPASVATVRDAVRQVAGARSWREAVVTTPEALAAAFAVDLTDVVIVHHQPAASDASIDALAVRIAGPAVGFLRAGGVVVVLDGEGPSRGTWPLAEGTGLLPVTGHTVVTFGEADVVSGTDALAVGLPLAYRAERASVGFVGAPLSATVVRVGQLPVVLHRVVAGR
ncbi:MAG: Tryptophan synthase alpha chain [Myxococcaceae bacterium]|nr:Tryptophan synthase alpha chain [Myxococcaceae bacterium]